MADEIKGKWAWEDYPEVQVKGYEEVPNVANQQRLADINKYLEVADEEVEPEVGQKIKRPLQALGYGVRKYITDPIYKGVDVVAQKGGNKIAEMLGARLSDKDKYGDVDFGKNAEREGYESLGDYFKGKDKYENDYQRYREALDDPMAWAADARGEDLLTEPKDADSRWASLTGTKAYEDWQPDTMVGKFIKGASGIAGDMLPSNLEGYAIEKAPQVVMGALAPMYKRLKGNREFANGWREQAINDMERGRMANANHHRLMADKADMGFFEDVDDVKAAIANRKKALAYAEQNPKVKQIFDTAKKRMATEDFDNYLKEFGGRLNDKLEWEGILDPERTALYRQDYLSDVAFQNRARTPEVSQAVKRHNQSGINGRKIKQLEDERKKVHEKWLDATYPKMAENAAEEERLGRMYDDINNELRELYATNQPKPLPNPAAQRAEALARNPQAIYSKQGKTMPRLVEALDGDGVVLLDENNVPVGFIEYNFKDFPKTGIDPREVREAMIELEGINPPVGSEKALPFRPNYASGKAMPSEDTLLNNFMREN